MTENPATDWRTQAIQKSLGVLSMENMTLNVLLREIMRHRPGASVVAVPLNRSQLLRFLERQADFRRLLAGRVSYFSDDLHRQFRDYTDWYEVTWEGDTPVEVALVPGTGHTGRFLCCADDADTLQRFCGALTDYAIRPQGRSLRYSGGWENAPDLDAEIGHVTWDDTVLPPNVLADLRDSVAGFVRHKDAYASLGFPWRRGLLLVGPPGTGKTMVCKAAASALPDLPFLYVRDLRPHQGQQAIQVIFNRARLLAPCLLALEDIDSLVTEGNRAAFLNELDGFQNNAGLLVIASSNHPGKLDEALLKRPSRFDRVYHLGLPELAERVEYCRRILVRSALTERLTGALDTEALARQVAERTDGFTPAYLKEVFVSAALQQAQQGVTALDQQFAAAALSQVDELRHHLQRLRDPDALAEIPAGTLPIGLRR